MTDDVGRDPDPGSAGADPPALRIAAFQDGDDVDAGFVTAWLLAGLDRKGHAVRLYYNEPELKRRASAMELLTRRSPAGGGMRALRAPGFARELRRRAPDVLLLNRPWPGAPAGRMAGLPRVVAWISGAEVAGTRLGRTAVRRWVDGVAFTAGELRDRFFEALPDFAGPAEVIHPAVPPPVLRGGSAFRAMLGIPLGAPLVETFAPLRPGQGLLRLVEVLEAVPGAHAVIVGEGPLRKVLARRAASAGVAERLHLVGAADDPGPALDAADLYVHTGVDGMSQRVLTALAAGRPVISAAAPGLEEALAPPDHGSGSPAGRVVGPDEELATVVAELLTDRGRLREMGASAADVARTRFEPGRMVDEWESFLRRVQDRV